MIKVVIIDDDSFICASLKTILNADADIEVAAVGASGEEAVDLYENLHPDVMLMDIRMGKFSGIDAGERILSLHKDARLLFLTTFSDDEYIIKALRMGAKGYLIKQNAEAVAPAIKAIMTGQSVFGSEVTLKLPSFINDEITSGLSAYGINSRESDIIKLVAKGCNNKEISDILFLSEGTVRNYISVILEKLELRDRTQLAILYYKHKDT